MNRGVTLGISISATVVVLLTIAMLFMPDWTRPPVEPVQSGYRGTGMELVYNPREVRADVAAIEIPAAIPQVPATGPTAGETYENVQVLGDLAVGQFTRLMAAVTEWVSPEQGCIYCHTADGNFASDNIYTKIVSRRMFQMTQNINANWADHVGATGVTCYTCHRGQPVPAEIWFQAADPRSTMGLAGNRAGQNYPAPASAMASLPYDPFTPFLIDASNGVSVIGTEALPHGNNKSIKQAEWTYGLMMHFSDALNINCTYCHNTRSFFAWDQSTPKRTTAFYGLDMVREMNSDYLIPLQGEYPDQRLGPLGDAPKANCATCHLGAYKPLYGANMLEDYPSLATVSAAE